MKKIDIINQEIKKIDPELVFGKSETGRYFITCPKFKFFDRSIFIVTLRGLNVDQVVKMIKENYTRELELYGVMEEAVDELMLKRKQHNKQLFVININNSYCDELVDDETKEV